VMSRLHESRERPDEAPSTSLERLPRAAVLVSEPLPLPSWQVYSLKDVAEALETLPPGLAQVYRLRMVDQLPTDAVVEKLHLPRPTVAARLVRALTRIRSVLKARGPVISPPSGGGVG
jgi:DNA-directed RNA polymerase specialized sigma24 family protein